MDDLTVTTTTHVEARLMLAVSGHMATWARIKFKPKKSRYMVILWSELVKKVILIEFTVPLEEGCEEAFERNQSY